MIVIEGMDNSGKSTLAIGMAEYLGLLVQESEGPPKSDEEINARVDKYDEARDRYLFVRHPCVSNMIYGQVRSEGDPVTFGRQSLFYERKPILIYCDAGDRGLEHHVIKDHDSPEHLRSITDNYLRLLQLYRLWAAERAHFVYRIGDDMEALIATIAFYQEYLKP